MPLRDTPILLPVETLNRELDGKLLLALHAAERGWRVIIGSREEMHEQILSFPRSIYFSKGIRSRNRAMFRILAARGHSIVGLDEEALVRLNDDLFLMKMDPVVLGLTQIVFSWGGDDARLYRQVPALETTPILETGNPRIDIMRPQLRAYFENEIAGIRQRFGRFALFNSNFAIVNHFIAERDRFKVASWVPGDEAQEMKDGVAGHKRALFTAFRELVPQLAAAVAPAHLVIRPHPSENHDTWRDAARDVDNVSVVHDGSVVPWLAAADVLVHNGCTSAVEAAVIGTPALCYRPVVDERFDNALPNGLSTEFSDAGALCAEAARILRVPRRDHVALHPARQALLDRHIAAFDGKLACEHLIDEIEEREQELRREADLIGSLSGAAKHIGRTVTRSIRESRAERSKNTAYCEHKFPAIGLDEIGSRIARFQRALGRFDGFGAREIRRNIFAIEKI